MTVLNESLMTGSYMRWNFYKSNVNILLQTILYELHNLNYTLSLDIIKVVYRLLFQSIFIVLINGFIQKNYYISCLNK